MVLDTVDSTNDEVRRRVAGGSEGGLVVVAERQTAGRGRRGRTWHSAESLGLYVSAGFRTRAPIAEVSRFTLAAAVAACEACREECRSTVTIQWPNDLTHDGRKLGGILCELRSAADGSSEVIVGLGINVFHGPDDFPPEIVARATSLSVASGASMLDREDLLVGYLARLGATVEALRRGEWAEVARRWSDLAPEATGAKVRLIAQDRHGSVEGTTAGIDGDGALLVRAADGALTRVCAVDTVLYEGE